MSKPPGVIDYIEYDGQDRPMNVITDGYRQWDFDWSEREQSVYYHESGGGCVDKVLLPQFVSPPAPPFKIYIREGLFVECARPELLDVLHHLAPVCRVFKPLWKLYRMVADRKDFNREATPGDFARLGLERIDSPICDPFEDAIEGELVYCSICDDRFPSEYTEHPCEHVWWNDGSGAGWVGPGADDGPPPAVSKAFMAWLEKEEKNLNVYDLNDWKSGAWAAWCAALGKEI